MLAMAALVRIWQPAVASAVLAASADLEPQAA
jgi:hypothetical protein